MPTDLEPKTVHDFIVNDFRAAWNAVAVKEYPKGGRGNFLFALHAALSFEWTCRLCHTDSSGKAIGDFEESLKSIQPLYFVTLPYPCPVHAGVHFSNRNDSLLILLMYDLIRNGVGHRYQQTVLRRPDGQFYVSLGGADYKRRLGTGPAVQHLLLALGDGEYRLNVWPDIWFLDVEAAVKRADLLSNTTLRAPDWSDHKKCRAFTVSGLANALVSGGLPYTGWAD